MRTCPVSINFSNFGINFLYDFIHTYLIVVTGRQREIVGGEYFSETALLYVRSEKERSVPGAVVSPSRQRTEKASDIAFDRRRDYSRPIINGDRGLGFMVRSELSSVENAHSFPRDIGDLGETMNERSANILLRIFSRIYLEEIQNQRWWIEFGALNKDLDYFSEELPRAVDKMVDHLTPFTPDSVYRDAVDTVDFLTRGSNFHREAMNMVHSARSTVPYRNELLALRNEKFWNLVTESYSFVENFQNCIDDLRGGF